MYSEVKSLKILGFMFDQRPGVAAQVAEIVKKTRARLWVLRHLRVFGFDEEELIAVYKTCVRSVIEFTSVVYHSMLTEEQSGQICPLVPRAGLEAGAEGGREKVR
jgi:hypothetical protein